MTDTWLTLGELRRLTADLPDDTPITVYGGDLECTGEWLNVELTKEAVDNFKAERDMSVILDVRDDFDTRQW